MIVASPPGGPLTIPGNLATSPPDRALYFYLQTTLVEVPPHSSLDLANSHLTLDAWVRPSETRLTTGAGTVVEPMVDKLSSLGPGGGGTGYAFYIETQTAPLNPPVGSTVTVTMSLVFVLGNGILHFYKAPIYTGTFVMPPPPQPPPAASPPWPGWIHVAVTVDRTQNVGRFYLNGTHLVASNFTPVVGVNNTAPLWIGGSRLYSVLSAGFGEIALNELEIFNLALPASDIQLIASASAGKCKPEKDAIADLGDAPDSTNNYNQPMTAYNLPPGSARFPTVFNDPIQPGPKHLNPQSLAWLGPDVSLEDEADLFPPDQDGLSNIDPSNDLPDRDGRDDGLVQPAQLPACGQIQLQYVLSTFASAPLSQPLYVNIWLDYNRDGDWEDSFKCPLGPAITGLADEWAIQNELLPAGTPPGAKTTTLFTAANLAPGKDLWVRITLSEQAAPAPPLGGNPDGRGPVPPYQFGETEDYLWKRVGLPPAESRCDLAIRKSVSPGSVPSGQPVTVTLLVQNVSNGPCPPDTRVQDPSTPGLTVPSQTVSVTQSGGPAAWSCLVFAGGVNCITAGTLPPGYQATFTFMATVTAPAGSPIQNCATVSNPNDTNPANNQSCVTIQVVRTLANPDLALAKLLDGQLRAEQEATYLLRVTNVGSGPTTGQIRVTDPLPPQLRFVSATGVGWSCSVSAQTVTCTSAGPLAPPASTNISLRVRVGAPAGTPIINCATVETAGDANSANNRGCHTGTVQR
jgi:uncharacterized repeat protein (TIGR01451 family)